MGRRYIVDVAFYLEMILLLALIGCISNHKVAHLEIPLECVDKIDLLKPVPLDVNGRPASKAEIKIHFHCTRPSKVR